MENSKSSNKERARAESSQWQNSVPISEMSRAHTLYPAVLDFSSTLSQAHSMWTQCSYTHGVSPAGLRQTGTGVFVFHNTISLSSLTDGPDRFHRMHQALKIALRMDSYSWMLVWQYKHAPKMTYDGLWKCLRARICGSSNILSQSAGERSCSQCVIWQILLSFCTMCSGGNQNYNPQSSFLLTIHFISPFPSLSNCRNCRTSVRYW